MNLPSLLRYALALLLIALGAIPMQAHAADLWGTFEVELPGPRDGNPFAEVELSAEFRCGDRRHWVDGFYDGDGMYRIRFMPDGEGQWSYSTQSNRPALDGKSGQFTCGPAAAGNHGPVRVGKNCQFAYADGTRYTCFGTTCYAWTHQPEELQEQTLRTLAAAPFNKLRMCVFPKNYIYTKNEPELYPFVKKSGGGFDLRRFDPAFWDNLERRISQLRDLDIEADLILFHPYDEGRWGFDRMDDATDDFYLRYVVARLAAYRNVWWALANEYDLMKHKQAEDWDRFFRILVERDPCQHLRSIHNGIRWYDHSKPWVTHASIQDPNPVRAAELREQYHKPVVFDECCYEGNIEWLWGNASPELMTQRFWDGFLHGGYVGHGETYVEPHDILWWSKGGVLHGSSPERIAFLRRIIEEAPAGLAPNTGMFGWESRTFGVLEVPGQYYLVYFGPHQPARKYLRLPKEGRFAIEVIDTWNMTITPLPGAYSGTCRLELPGKPYIAVRVRRQDLPVAR
jgi:hypothetical protein